MLWTPSEELKKKAEGSQLGERIEEKLAGYKERERERESQSGTVSDQDVDGAQSERRDFERKLQRKR